MPTVPAVCDSGTTPPSITVWAFCRENGPDPNLGRGRRNAARAADTAEHAAAIAERKRKQDALSKKKNEETYKRLTAQVRPPSRHASDAYVASASVHRQPTLPPSCSYTEFPDICYMYTQPDCVGKHPQPWAPAAVCDPCSPDHCRCLGLRTALPGGEGIRWEPGTVVEAMTQRWWCFRQRRGVSHA